MVSPSGQTQGSACTSVICKGRARGPCRSSGRGESTKIESVVKMFARARTSFWGILLSIVVLIAVLSGCSSVISNSEGFYKDRPRGRINWREYTSD